MTRLLKWPNRRMVYQSLFSQSHLYAVYNTLSPALPPVYIPCVPEDCSGHGDCDAGVCVCDPEWSGPACALGQIPLSLRLSSPSGSPPVPFSSLSSLVTRSLVNVTFERGVGVGSDHDFVGLYLDSS